MFEVYQNHKYIKIKMRKGLIDYFHKKNICGLTSGVSAQCEMPFTRIGM